MKFTAIILAILTWLCGLFGFVPIDKNDYSELSNYISQCESTIEDLEAKNATTNDELSKEIQEFNDLYDEYNRLVKDVNAKVEDLESLGEELKEKSETLELYSKALNFMDDHRCVQIGGNNCITIDPVLVRPYLTSDGLVDELGFADYEFLEILAKVVSPKGPGYIVDSLLDTYPEYHVVGVESATGKLIAITNKGSTRDPEYAVELLNNDDYLNYATNYIQCSGDYGETTTVYVYTGLDYFDDADYEEMFDNCSVMWVADDYNKTVCEVGADGNLYLGMFIRETNEACTDDVYKPRIIPNGWSTDRQAKNAATYYCSCVEQIINDLDHFTSEDTEYIFISDYEDGEISFYIVRWDADSEELSMFKQTAQVQEFKDVLEGTSEWSSAVANGGIVFYNNGLDTFTINNSGVIIITPNSEQIFY